MAKKMRGLRLSERTWNQLRQLAPRFQVDDRTRVIEILAERESAKMADWRICSECGEEYEATGGQHDCDPRSVEWVKAADEEIKRQQNEKSNSKGE